MSVNEQQIPSSHPLVSANTTARSIQNEWKDSRTVPEDMRERRFGYNPGLRMSMDPVISGLQVSLIEAGVAILFESGPVKRPRHSVDAFDRNPLDIDAELLAGEGLEAILFQHHQMGFVELRPLRGKSDQQAGQMLDIVHPALADVVKAGLLDNDGEPLKKCPYDLEVCVTCRLAALNAIKATGRLPESVMPLFDVVHKSVTTCLTYIRGEWSKWVSEMAARNTGMGGEGGLRVLSEDHLPFMRHLHERTPNEQELAKIAMQTEGQASVLRESMTTFAEQIAAAMREKGDGQNAQSLAAAEMAAQELAALKEGLRQQQEQLNELIAKARGDQKPE